MNPMEVIKMKISMFTNVASYIDWAMAHRENLERSRDQENETFIEELAGMGRFEFLNANLMLDEPEEVQQNAWLEHLNWRAGNLAYMDRKISNLDKEIAKAQAML